MSGPFCSTKIRPPEAAYIFSDQAGLILVNEEVRAPLNVLYGIRKFN